MIRSAGQEMIATERMASFCSEFSRGPGHTGQQGSPEQREGQSGGTGAPPAGSVS